jgi:hypothetical protein
VCDYITGKLPGESWNLDFVRKLQLFTPEDQMFGRIGKCGVCGARYHHGTLFKHVPSGDLVHMGHNCVDLYSFLANHAEWHEANEDIKRRKATAIQDKINSDRRAKQLADNPGLAEAFETKHHIVQNIKAQFENSRWAISANQIALVLKIAREQAKRDEERAREVHVPAPEGRCSLRGVLVSKKLHDSQFGEVVKGTIKVTTPDGTWLAWGTLPNSLWDLSAGANPEVGDEVELTGTLSRGNEAHFAFFKRPSKGKLFKKA